MKHIMAVMILSISSALSMDTLQKDILRAFKVDTKSLEQQNDEEVSIMNSAYLAVVTPEGMHKCMGPELEELQRLPNIKFHKFDEAQLEFYDQSPDKVVKFKQGEARVVSKLPSNENRLIFSNHIIDCVALFIWKTEGPAAFAHFDKAKVADGHVGRVLAKFDDQTLENKKLFQVYLISTTYSENVRTVYSNLIEAGFQVTAKTIFDMYYNDATQTRYIASSSLGQSFQLEAQTTEQIVGAFEGHQNRPMIPHVLAATLKDGNLYEMQDAVGLVEAVGTGKSSQIQVLLKKLEDLEPDKAQAIIHQLQTGSTLEQVLVTSS